MRRFFVALATVVVILAFFVPAAGATNYCAGEGSAPACPGGTGTASLQAALTAAGATAEPDFIALSAQQYPENDLHYTNTEGSPGNNVTLTGPTTGGRAQLLRDDGFQDTVFNAQSTNARVTFAHVDLFVGSGNPAGAFNAIVLQGADLTDVHVDTGPSLESGTHLLNAQGAVNVTDSTLDGGNLIGIQCVAATATTTKNFVNTTFQDCETGITTAQAPSVFVSRCRFIGGGPSGTTPAINFEGNTGTLRLDNSLIARAPGAVGVRIAPTATQTHDVVINQSTFILTGSGGVGLIVDTTSGSTTVANVSLFDTLFAGDGGQGTITQQSLISSRANNTITKEFNFYDFTAAALDPFETFAATDIDAFPDSGPAIDPGFVGGVGSDPFALSSTSVLRDKDSTANAFRLPGEPTIGGDLLGLSRISNGARDVGAYEFQFVPPVVNPPDGVAAAAAPPAISALKSLKAKKGKKAKLAYSLSAPVKVSFSAKPKKGKKPKSKVLGSQQGKAGKNTFSFKVKLKKGKYTLTVTPADGVPKTTTLTVK